MKSPKSTSEHMVLSSNSSRHPTYLVLHVNGLLSCCQSIQRWMETRQTCENFISSAAREGQNKSRRSILAPCNCCRCLASHWYQFVYDGVHLICTKDAASLVLYRRRVWSFIVCHRQRKRLLYVVQLHPTHNAPVVAGTVEFLAEGSEDHWC